MMLELVGRGTHEELFTGSISFLRIIIIIYTFKRREIIVNSCGPVVCVWKIRVFHKFDFSIYKMFCSAKEDHKMSASVIFSSI